MNDEPGMSIFEVATRPHAGENERIMAIYDAAIQKYEGEVKGFQIMLRREELSGHSAHVKRHNIDMWKAEIRKAKYNLTRTRNLRKALG